jgi:hypothetical protein
MEVGALLLNESAQSLIEIEHTLLIGLTAAAL